MNIREITKCQGYNCSIKHLCFRYTCEEAEYQAYFDHEPTKGKDCEYFLLDD